MANFDDEYQYWAGLQGKSDEFPNKNNAWYNGHQDYNRELFYASEVNKAEKENRDSGGSCWVATAYYGDSSHPEVEALRKLRNDIFNLKLIGPAANVINKLYHNIGRTMFGKYWSIKLRRKTEFSIARLITKFFLILLSHSLKLLYFVRRK